MSEIIRIGTRKSALALIQTHLIADELKRAWPDIEVELVTKETLGDKILDKPLQEFGGKGVFVSEFEQAMKEGTIDLAVHSAKDLPMDLGKGLAIAAVSGRGDPRDVLVTMKGAPWDRQHIVIGTSSPRRQLEAAEYRGQLWPGAGSLTCATLRGNVHTRLRKLEQGLYDWTLWKILLMIINIWTPRCSFLPGDRESWRWRPGRAAMQPCSARPLTTGKDACACAWSAWC